jgi:hypothetical protein
MSLGERVENRASRGESEKLGLTSAFMFGSQDECKGSHGHENVAVTN